MLGKKKFNFKLVFFHFITLSPSCKKIYSSEENLFLLISLLSLLCYGQPKPVSYLLEKFSFSLVINTTVENALHSNTA